MTKTFPSFTLVMVIPPPFHRTHDEDFSTFIDMVMVIQPPFHQTRDEGHSIFITLVTMT